MKGCSSAADADSQCLGLAVAVCSPVSVVTVIVLLTMPAGRRRAIAFVAGWLLAIAVIGAIAVFVLHGQDFSSHKTTPSRAASAAENPVGLHRFVRLGSRSPSPVRQSPKRRDS
jgi:hypothetical protein